MRAFLQTGGLPPPPTPALFKAVQACFKACVHPPPPTPRCFLKVYEFLVFQTHHAIIVFAAPKQTPADENVGKSRLSFANI